VCWGLPAAQQSQEPAAEKPGSVDAAQPLSVAERFRRAYEQRDQQQAEKTLKVCSSSMCTCLQQAFVPPICAWVVNLTTVSQRPREGPMGTVQALRQAARNEAQRKRRALRQAGSATLEVKRLLCEDW
jgi:hypothetical protein